MPPGAVHCVEVLRWALLPQARNPRAVRTMALPCWRAGPQAQVTLAGPAWPACDAVAVMRWGRFGACREDGCGPVARGSAAPDGPPTRHRRPARPHRLGPGSTDIAAALTDRFHARPESSAEATTTPATPEKLTQDAMVGRRQHAGKPGSSLVRAGCALHLHRPADLPAARREGLVREAACHLSLAGHRRLPAPGRPARASPCPSSAAKPRSRDFEARVIALQARGDHGR